MAKTTSTEGLNSGVEDSTNDEASIGTAATAAAESIIKELEKQAASELSREMRVSKIVGNSSAELEEILTTRWPQLSIHRTKEKQISFYLPNGRIIKI